MSYLLPVLVTTPERRCLFIRRKCRIIHIIDSIVAIAIAIASLLSMQIAIVHWRTNVGNTCGRIRWYKSRYILITASSCNSRRIESKCRVHCMITTGIWNVLLFFVYKINIFLTSTKSKYNRWVWSENFTCLIAKKWAIYLRENRRNPLPKFWFMCS